MIPTYRVLEIVIRILKFAASLFEKLVEEEKSKCKPIPK